MTTAINTLILQLASEIKHHKKALYDLAATFRKMMEKMKKFKIINTDQNKWLVSHNEFPKFTCLFENKKFNYHRTIMGLADPTGDPKEIQLFQKMEKWLKEYHKEKIDG